MAYGLEKLLSVRVLREEKARNHLSRVKTELVSAQMQRHRKEKELVDYRHWRIKEEKRLFGVLKGKPASRCPGADSPGGVPAAGSTRAPGGSGL